MLNHDDRILPSLLYTLDDTEFHRQFESIASIEHAATMKVLHFINDLDRRKSYLDLGYSSVFDYCVRKIGYSRSAAGRRIQAARCARRYPVLFGMLRNREVTFSAAALIEPILNDDNRDFILGRIRGASHRDVERIVSEYRPAPGLCDRIQYVRVPEARAHDIDGALFDRETKRAIPEAWRNAVPSVEKVFVQFLADEDFLALFEEVRDLVSNAPGRTFADVIRAVLTEYRDRHSPVARQGRREARVRTDAMAVGKAAGTARSGQDDPYSRRREWKSQTHGTSRHVSGGVRDKVFVRDEGRCSYVAADGTRCQCTTGLQVDHIVPFANGGTHNPSNLRLLCGGHNRLAAEKAMGKQVMQPYWR